MRLVDESIKPFNKKTEPENFKTQSELFAFSNKYFILARQEFYFTVGDNKTVFCSIFEYVKVGV